MIERRELLHAIETFENSPNLNTDTCVKLAALYTIYNELYGSVERVKTEVVGIIETDESTEFYQAIIGKELKGVLSVINELMETLQALNSRGYSGVIEKLKNTGTV